MATDLLVVNLGSPQSPQIPDVKQYLKEFLMDPEVIDIAWPLRALLVYGIVLNFRPAKSAHAYQKIWTEAGSPLIEGTRKISQELGAILPGVRVEMAMRYGQPSIYEGLKKLSLSGSTEVFVQPFYPQYSRATTQTVIDQCLKIAQKNFPHLTIRFGKPFFNDWRYIDTLIHSLDKPVLQSSEALVMSYHGLPLRQILKSGNQDQKLTHHCKFDQSCCLNPSPLAMQYCYRSHCIQTSKAIQTKLAIKYPHLQFYTVFQSRFGNDKWLEPSLDSWLSNCSKQGIKKIAVCAPAFFNDCLETLEEIAIRGKQTFIDNGGQSFEYIDCIGNNVVASSKLIKELFLNP